ncbi:SDR family NAD(P)-dependent oxidoreductase [Blautia sp. RD014234]|nr:SDR family NAD(P)-dependent oxidoreductase [Blautia parvula]
MKNTALITGATSGLGLSYAKYFASAGYDPILTGRRREIIQKRGNTAKAVPHKS